MKRKFLVVNGPSLDLLGKRQTELYGSQSLLQIIARLSEIAEKNNVVLEHYQSNHEGEIVSRLNECVGKYQGIIINPAAYSHTSIAILDALLALNVPTIEVHLTNIYKRESFRRVSITAQSAIGQICGLGMWGYVYALQYFIDHHAE